MKRLLRSTAVLAALLVVTGVAAWLLRDTIALSVANRLLPGTGLRVIELSGIRPSLRRITVDELVVEQIGSGQLQVLGGIAVTYSLAGLRSGQLRDIRIESADLELAPDAEAAAPATEAPRLTDTVEMVRRAPLRSLAVEQLRINDRPMALTLRWQANGLAGELGDGETGIELDIDWMDESAGDPQALPPAMAPFRVNLSARTGSRSPLGIAVDIVPRGDLLDVRTSAQVDSDNAWPVITAVAGLLALPLPETLPLTVSAAVEAEARIPDALAVPRTMQLTATIGSGGRVVRPASTVSGADIGAVEGRWEAPVTLALEQRDAGSAPQWTVSGQQLTMNIAHLRVEALQVSAAALALDDYRMECLSLSLSRADCDFSTRARFDAESVAVALAGTGAPEPVRLREPSLTLPTLDGSLVNNTVALQASADTQLNLPEVGYAALSARNTEAILHTSASIDVPLGDIDALRLRAGELSVDLPLLRSGGTMAGLKLRARELDTRPLGGFMLDAGLELSNAYTNLFSLNLWDATLTADLSVENGAAGFDATIGLNEHEAAIITGTHDLAAFTGGGRIEVPDVTFDESGNRLTDFISPLPVPLDVLSGAVGGEAQLQWQWPEGRDIPAITGTVDITLTDIGGRFEDAGFSHLDTRVHARLDDNWHLRSMTEQTLRIGRVDIGLPIEDIETRFRFDSDGPALYLRDMGLALFGGRVTAEHLDYDASAGSTTSTLHLERIDIERILSLSAYQGITATGIVSGQIPLTIQGMQLTVDGGTLGALPPGGTIRYRDGPTDPGNPNLELLYSALRNYRYDSLEAQVDYREDGELLLDVSMEGVAPEVGQGQRINLNVTISDNIPALLESLQAGRNVVDALEL